ncbi:MAG: 2-hydroxyacid dehydrogenase [Rhodospirillales bacterium]|nr:2-hydroxyacid dehydrogenase [Rhodospirillales bacterium]MBN8906165.1 2-hydroxyacid dehydrogenase [Rhodospirillales bacterium]
MPKLLQITAIHPDAQARLAAGYELVHAELPQLDAAWLARHGAEIEGVVTGGHLGLPAAVMTGLPRLRVIAINGVGFDKVDLALARSRGVRVTNTPDVLTDDVADLAVGLTLALLRRLPQADAYVRAGRWPAGEMPLATKLTGKRIGIFGLGRIGRAAARRFAGFTDAIAYADVTRQDVPFTWHPDPVALAAGSDVLVICAAASADTRRIIGTPVFEALGPSGVLVNVARGSIVDEPALVAALQAGRLGGAALDVFEDEPNVPAALIGMENVVVTPHIASATNETRRAMGELMIDNIDAVFAGRPIPAAVV